MLQYNEKMSGSMACNYIPSAWNKPMQRKCKKIVGKVMSTHECVFSKDKGQKIEAIDANDEGQKVIAMEISIMK
jgi:hypothetical protein